jgi:hypothetical protein
MNIGDEIQAFGPRAQRYAESLPSGIPAIISDGADPARALAAAAERRRKGVPFFTSILAEDPRALLGSQLGGQIYAQISDYDGRRQAFDQLAQGALAVDGRPMRDIQVFDPRALQTHRTFLLMGDALLVRSETERRRVEYLVARPNEPGRTREHVAVLAGRDARVPAFRRDGGADSIVVWAPEAPAALTAVIVFALEELKTPLLVVCAGGSLPGSRATFLEFGQIDAAEVLSRAQVVVDASIGDPSAALALAASGTPLCVAATSGAHEFLDGISRYEPACWETILSAVSAARSGATPRVRNAAGILEAEGVLAATQATISDTDGPLVSIVIPTFNRPDFLEQALRRLENQRYQNLEIIVANDGGCSIEDVVARFAGVKLVNLPSNLGAGAAFNAGVAASNGEYILDLADDDLIYPDCVGRLVFAAMRTKAPIIHGNLIQRFDELGDDGKYRTYGYFSQYDVANDPTATLSGMTVLNTSAIVHRRVLEALGGYATDVKGNDYDFQIHAAKLFEYVHVDAFVAEMAVRNDRTSTSGTSDIAEAVRQIYTKYPIEGRPYIEARRQSLLAEVTRRQGQDTFWEPELRV